MENLKTVAIVVTYMPEVSGLANLLSAIIAQVDEIVIVDNATPDSYGLKKLFLNNDSIHFIELSENFGIAYAHNLGIEWAYEHSADYVLLLDQDSIPSSNMVELLSSDLTKNYKLFGLPVAAIGPRFIDSRTNTASAFLVSRNGFPYRHRPKIQSNPQHLIPVSFLISSGCLIRMETLLQYGGMRSDYFIDHVDTEWCFRLKSHGNILVVDSSATMLHTLGDKVRRVWFFYMRNISYHSPLRDYYMFRNTFLMLRDVKLPLVWKFFFIGRLMQHASYFLLFSPQRVKRFNCILTGIKHGLKSIRGRLDTHTLKCTPIPKTKFDPK